MEHGGGIRELMKKSKVGKEAGFSWIEVEKFLAPITWYRWKFTLSRWIRYYWTRLGKNQVTWNLVTIASSPTWFCILEPELQLLSYSLHECLTREFKAIIAWLTILKVMAYFTFTMQCYWSLFLNNPNLKSWFTDENRQKVKIPRDMPI